MCPPPPPPSLFEPQRRFALLPFQFLDRRLLGALVRLLQNPSCWDCFKLCLYFKSFQKYFVPQFYLENILVKSN